MDQSRQETSAGAVVFRRTADTNGFVFLLILDGHGNWGFPKGHVESGETWLEAARREVREETGIEETVNHGDLGSTSWMFTSSADPPARVCKTCHFYLFETDQERLTPGTAEGIGEAVWLPADAVPVRLTFPAAREVFDRARLALSTPASGSV